MKTIVFIPLMLLFFSSCQSGLTGPETQLKDYVEYRFSSDQSREEILTRTTEPLRSKFEQMDKEVFDQYMLKSNGQLKSFRTLNSNCELKTTCYITYEIKYTTLKGDKKAFTSEVKKIAELRLIDNAWKIADVNNIKTFHDSHQEITP